MGSALPVLAALIQAASMNVDLGIRTEGRASTLSPSGLPDETRGLVSAAPRATVAAEAAPVWITAGYAPRLWTSDIEEQPSPLVNHTVDSRLELRPDGRWRASLTATAVRARTDPLADPWQAAEAAGGMQVATTESHRYEQLRLGLGAELVLNPRTSGSAAAGWELSRDIGEADELLRPPQRVTTLEASLVHLVTEFDTFRVTAEGARIVTSAAAEDTVTAYATAMATWRRRFAPTMEGWLGGGATVTEPEEGSEEDGLRILPAAEAGLAGTAEGRPLDYSIAARLTTFVDRFTGEVSPLASALGTLGWRVDQRLLVQASASAGARPDGETLLGHADLRATWTVRERFAIDLGVAGGVQRDRRPELPYFVEGAAFGGIAWTLQERLVLETGVLARRHVEYREDRSFFEGAAFVALAYASDGLFRVGRAESPAAGN